MMRRRTAAPLVAGLALALTAVSLPAAALGTSTGPALSGANDPIVIVDGSSGEVFQLRDELFGRITVVPGSEHRRSVTVQNMGPSDATLTVAIVNASGLPADDRGEDTFFDDLLVNGIPAATLEGAERIVMTVPLDQGETVQVPFDVTFPREATSGNAALVGEREFAFDVRLTLTGETPQPEPPPGPAGPAGPAGKTGKTGTSGPVAQTGGMLDGIDVRLIAAAAALAALAAVAARPALARRSPRDNDE